MSTATAVFLVYIATLGNGNSVSEKNYPMKDWESCITAVKVAQVRLPSGGEAETTVTLFCTTSLALPKR